jgi:hypothetical protein
VSDRALRFPDRTWDELEGLPQPLRNAAHRAIFHLLEEPVPALAEPFPEVEPPARYLPSPSTLRLQAAPCRFHGSYAASDARSSTGPVRFGRLGPPRVRRARLYDTGLASVE